MAANIDGLLRQGAVSPQSLNRQGIGNGSSAPRQDTQVAQDQSAADIRIRQIRYDAALARKNGYTHSQAEIDDMNRRIGRLRSGLPKYEDSE